MKYALFICAILVMLIWLAPFSEHSPGRVPSSFETYTVDLGVSVPIVTKLPEHVAPATGELLAQIEEINRLERELQDLQATEAFDDSEGQE